MRSTRPTLGRAVAELTILLEVAYALHLSVCLNQVLGHKSKRAKRDLETLIEGVIPDSLAAHEGVDGGLAWFLANLALRRRRGLVTRQVVQQAPETVGNIDGERAWRTFRSRLALSRAGLEWGQGSRWSQGSPS